MCFQEPSDEQDGSAPAHNAAWQGLKGVKIHLLTGDLKKTLLSRSKYSNLFSAMLIGHRHAHLVDKEHELLNLAFPGALLAVETVKYMLQLNNKQVSCEHEHSKAGMETLLDTAVPSGCSVKLLGAHVQASRVTLQDLTETIWQ